MTAVFFQIIKKPKQIKIQEKPNEFNIVTFLIRSYFLLTLFAAI